MRHPRDMGVTEVEAFLTMLATERKASASTHKKLLYGTGMRMMEGIRLRIKDVDFDRHVIIVREAKGGKDRVVMLPHSLAPTLRLQMLAAWTTTLEVRLYWSAASPKAVVKELCAFIGRGLSNARADIGAVAV